MNDLLNQVIAELRAKQAQDERNQRDRLAGASPEILDFLAEYGLIGPQQEVALGQMKMADKQRNTPMPQGITVRDQYIAPSILGTAAATIDRIQGSRDYDREKQALMAGFLRKMQANRAFGQAEQDDARRQIAAEAAAAPVPGAGEGLTTPTLLENARSWEADTTGQDIMHDFSAGKPAPRKPTAADPALPAVGNVNAPLQPRYQSRNPWRGFTFDPRKGGGGW